MPALQFQEKKVWEPWTKNASSTASPKVSNRIRNPCPRPAQLRPGLMLTPSTIYVPCSRCPVFAQFGQVCEPLQFDLAVQWGRKATCQMFYSPTYSGVHASELGWLTASSGAIDGCWSWTTNWPECGPNRRWRLGRREIRSRVNLLPLYEFPSLLPLNSAADLDLLAPDPLIRNPIADVRGRGFSQNDKRGRELPVCWEDLFS